jgi:hypothetical protein
MDLQAFDRVGTVLVVLVEGNRMVEGTNRGEEHHMAYPGILDQEGDLGDTLEDQNVDCAGALGSHMDLVVAGNLVEEVVRVGSLGPLAVVLVFVAVVIAKQGRLMRGVRSGSLQLGLLEEVSRWTSLDDENSK